MAYEISSSIAAGTAVLQLVSGSSTQARASGGHFSPDGTKLAVPVLTTGVAGGSGVGVDIYTSSSASGWAPTEFVSTGNVGGSSRYANTVQWISNSEIAVMLGSYGITTFGSGSSGWSNGIRRTTTTNTSAFHYNPSKTLLAIYRPTYGGGDDYVNIMTSGSGQWSYGSTIDEPGGSGKLVTAAEWLSDTDIAVGVPDYDVPGQGNTNSGEVSIWRTTDGGSSFSEIEAVQGTSNGDKLGASIYYHSASGNLIVGTGMNSATVASSTGNTWYLYQSTSAGGYVQANTDRTELTNVGDSSGRAPLQFYKQEDNINNRFAITLAASSNAGSDAEILIWESGSSGWKASVIDDDVRLYYPTNGGMSQVGMSKLGAVANNNDVTPTNGNKHFRVRQTPAPSGGGSALSNTETSTIGASGGTVSAGGTEASPLATITIPAGALGSNATIGVDLTGNDDAKTNGINSSAGTVGLTTYSPVVEVTPHGQTFASAVTLSFQLTGAVAGTKPADLVVYKSLTADGPWYKLPSAFYACSNTGVITLTATSFSRYQAQGGNNMARTQLNNNQIAKLVKPNKAVARAIDLTGSLSDQNGAAYISATDLLVLHRTGSQAQPVSASVLQDFFSKVDVVETGTDAAFQLLFADDDSVGGGDGVLRVDGSHLTYNPNSNLLSVGGDLNLGGHLVADADEAKNIFAAVTTAGNSITIGGGADIVLGGDLQLAAAGLINDAGGHVRFTATDTGATILGAADGTAGLTLAANNSSVTIAGDLVVSGNDVTFGNGATIVNGDANTLTITEATLAVSADLNLGGHLVADADEAKNIFAAVTTAGNSITIGGGADIVLGGDLKMAAAGRIEDAGGHARFTATDSGATILGAADGTAGLTLAANNSSVTVAGDLTVSGNDLDFSAGNATIGASVGSANLTLGAGSSTVIIPGNLTVQGEVTSVDSTTINVSSSFTFEGFADAHETTLHAGGDGTGDTPQADTSIYLPALSAGNYFLPVLADKATAASSAVLAAEFALLDGGSTVGTTALASGDGFLHNDGGTMRQTSINKIADLFAGEGLASSAGVLNITGSGISAEAIAVGADTFMFFDSDGSPKQESFADLATAQAGAGLAASSGQLVVDVSEFSAVTPAASDSFLTLDSDGSTEQRTTTDALATLFAGSGMTASSAVISVANASNGGIAVAADDIKVDIDDLAAVTAIASGDTFAMAQQAEPGDPTKKITFDNMAAKLGGAGLTPTAGVLAVVNASNGGIAVAADDIKVDIDDLTAVTAIASGDTFAIAQQDVSGDPTKKITFDNMATKLAGDGLAASSGVLAIQSVQRSFQSASSAVTTGSAVNITDNYGSAIVQASFHVYLNGMLQTRSGSLEANQTIFDYEVSGTTLTLQSEMDSDDVLIVSYIKKS